MELVLLLMIGGGTYLFIKGKGRWNMEQVRAHVFMEALANGETLKEANSYAMVVMALPSTKGIRNLAKLHCLHDFHGKPAEMIQSSYDAGLVARLSSYEREFFGVRERNATPGRTQSGSNTSIAPQSATGGGMSGAKGGTTYRVYYDAYVAELKRLAKLGPDDLHPVELMEEDNVELAFADKVDPLILAAMVHDHSFKGHSLSLR